MVEVYDNKGNLASVMNALGQTRSWSNYNQMGQAGRMVDINGVATDYGYDAKGNLTTVTQQLPGSARVTTLAYDNSGRVTDISGADGRVARYRYLAGGRLNRVGNALNEFVQTDVNVASNTWTSYSDRKTPGLSGQTPVANAAGTFLNTTQTDTLGRPWKVSGNNGQLVTYSYDGNGNVLTVQDAAGRTTTHAYDAQGRRTSTLAPDGGTMSFHYDVEGQLDYVEDPRGLKTYYTYNAFGDRLTQVSPDTGTTTYTYDSVGRIATETKANGQVITYTWDALDRMLTRSISGQTETFTYDEGTYGKGRLTRINDGSGQTTFTYNAAGELVTQVAIVNGQTYTTSWNYDAAGRLLGMSYPTGVSLGYSYDSVGRLSGVTSNHTGGTSTLADSFLYQPATNRPYAWRFGNGLATLMTLDTDGRVGGLQSPYVHGLTYAYGVTNTVQQIADSVYSSQSSSFAYAPSDRVQSVTRSGDSQSFVWDGVGNRN